jgi:hypothetical protein
MECDKRSFLASVISIFDIHFSAQFKLKMLNYPFDVLKATTSSSDFIPRQFFLYSKNFAYIS